MIKDILIAVAVVVSIGIICGIVLALASHFMAVKKDEKAEKLRAVLPGVNCGACGYTGCDGYAAALAKGEAKPNLCVPGADKVSAEISNILGISFEDVEEMTAFVHCNGNNSDSLKKSEYEGIKSCKAAALVYGGPRACVYSCLGFGDCAAVCPSNAICVKDGVARVDPRRCIGCGLCVKTCPKKIISLIPVTAKTAVICSNKEKGVFVRKECQNGCIACKKCEMNCPDGAIKVIDNLAVIDYKKCTRCGICADVCPVKCIKKTDFSASPLTE